MNVENWSAVPPGRANATALLTTIAAMAILISYEPEDMESIEFMRASALLLMAVHAILHVGTANALRVMALMELPHAEEALEAYRDPHRLSHLDLSATWLGFYSLAPVMAGA